ncbi:hypothetical protein H8959_008478 [Pygathrix nigripes]
MLEWESLRAVRLILPLTGEEAGHRDTRGSCLGSQGRSRSPMEAPFQPLFPNTTQREVLWAPPSFPLPLLCELKEDIHGCGAAVTYDVSVTPNRDGNRALHTPTRAARSFCRVCHVLRLPVGLVGL